MKLVLVYAGNLPSPPPALGRSHWPSWRRCRRLPMCRVAQQSRWDSRCRALLAQLGSLTRCHELFVMLANVSFLVLGGSPDPEGCDPDEGPGLVQFESVASMGFEEVVVTAQRAQVGHVGRPKRVLDHVVVIADGCAHGTGGCDARRVVRREMTLQCWARIVPFFRGSGEPAAVIGFEVVINLDSQVRGSLGDQGSSRHRIDRTEAEHVGHIPTQNRCR